MKRLHKQTSVNRFFLLGLYVSLFTLVPFLILNYIESQKSEALTLIFYSVLPGLIPGFYVIFGLFYFGFLILFIYGIFAIRKENSYLYKIKFFHRLKTKVEEKREKEIMKLEMENENIRVSDVFTVIPQQYNDLHAIGKMREYLINTRANNLREAIEIYELELHRERQIAVQAATLASAQQTEEHAKQAEASARKAEQSANAVYYRRR